MSSEKSKKSETPIFKVVLKPNTVLDESQFIKNSKWSLEEHIKFLQGIVMLHI